MSNISPETGDTAVKKPDRDNNLVGCLGARCNGEKMQKGGGRSRKCCRETELRDCLRQPLGRVGAFCRAT